MSDEEIDGGPAPAMPRDVDLIAKCRVCGERWDINRDPTACSCEDPGDDDWTLRMVPHAE
jgi:hypothetical protein